MRWAAVLFALVGCGPPPRCAAGELRDDSGECVPESCGAGPFGEAVGDLYVQPGAAAGDGSRERPLGSLSLALAAVDAEHRSIALAAGDYAVNLSLGADLAGLSIAGRCAERVTLWAEVPAEPVVHVKALYTALSGLTLAGGRPGALVSGGTLAMDRVVVQDSQGAGVACVDAEALEMTRSAVHGVFDVADNATSEDAFGEGGGVYLYHCEAQLEDLELWDNAPAGINAWYSQLSLSGARIDASRPVPMVNNFANGIGLLLVDSDATVDALQITDTAAAGVYCQDGQLRLTDGEIVGTRGVEGEDLAQGVQGVDGCTLDITGLRVERSMGSGIEVYDGVLRGEDIAIAALREEPDEGSAAAGVKIYGLPASGERSVLSDVTVHDVSGYGVFVSGGGELRVNRLTVSEVSRDADYSAAIGVYVQNLSTVDGSGVEVSGVDGPGVRVYTGSTILCAGCVLAENRFAGAVAQNGSRLELTDGTVILNNRPHHNSGGGFGVFSDAREGNSHVRLSEASIGPHALASVYYEGIPLADAGEALIVSDSVIYGGEAAAVDRPSANALVALSVERSQVLLSRSTLIGSGSEAVLLHQADAQLHELAVQDNATDARWQACPDGDVGGDAAEVPTAEVCVGYDLPMRSIRFTFSNTDVVVE